MPVLITGIGRVRKVRIARQIHEGSSRAARAFLQGNCETLLKDGGAHAVGGTVFLPQIDTLDFVAQDRLSGWLSDIRRVKPTGESSSPIHVRLIAGTESDLFAAVQAGTFRGDLYYRLNVTSVQVPREL